MQKLTKDDFRKQKVIDEARKSGTIPAEVDPTTGKDINPHIPQYMSQAPWYLDINHPTLKHQRNTVEEFRTDLDTWYKRGEKQGPAATKYRKGACENCGAMTHKKKDCVERPRKNKAKYTGKEIQADEVIMDIKLDFDAKRDRWNGYDPNQQQATIEEWELIDEERKKLREEEVKKNLKLGINLDNSDDEEANEDAKGYGEDMDMPGTKLDTKTRTTVRNLRMREDTAKYLLNLDVNSSYYDPKTRSMRDNPLKHKDPSELSYAGDNFVRYTGDAPKHAQLQLYAWDQAKKNPDVHLLANPTQVEMMNKKDMSQKEAKTNVLKGSIIEKYGGEEHLKVPSKDLLLAQTEQYVEYSQTGKLIKGQEKAVAKSIYEEDVFPLNHTKVWGSYWNQGNWGYACCNSTLRNSYCSGKAGKEAMKASEEMMIKKLEQKKKEQLNKPLVNKKSTTEDSEELDKEKLEIALKNEKARNEEGATLNRKRKYNTAEDMKEVTKEELEAFRINKQRNDDPMLHFKDDDDL